MSLTVIVKSMVASGCTPEQISAAVEAHQEEYERKLAEKREKDAARQRRKRHAESRGVTRTERDSQAKKEKNQKKKTIPPSDIPPTGDISSSPQQSLESVLRSDLAKAVVEHRKSLKSPLTVSSAGLLAKKFAKHGDPNENAETMLARGWRGFEPEWLDNRKGTGPPPENELMAAARRNIERAGTE